jgi:hypothetical protein
MLERQGFPARAGRDGYARFGAWTLVLPGLLALPAWFF